VKGRRQTFERSWGIVMVDDFAARHGEEMRFIKTKAAYETEGTNTPVQERGVDTGRVFRGIVSWGPKGGDGGD